MTTIRDVAKLAKVSLSTASRALSGSPAVVASTRLAVEEAARALNFRPSSLGRALSNRQAGLLGVLTPRLGGHYFSTILEAAERTIRAAGKHVIVVSSVDPTDETWGDTEGLAYLTDRDCDGILLLASELSEAELIVLAERFPAIALFNRQIPALAGNCFSADHHGAGRAVAEHLLRRGHRNIATITGPMGTEDARLRHEGFAEVLAEAGIPLDPRLVTEGNYRFESGMPCASALLASGLEFTALFCGSDEMAIAAHSYLARNGKTPEIVGYDDIEVLTYSELSIASVSVPTAEIASNACHFLLNRCFGGDRPVQRQFSTKLVLR